MSACISEWPTICKCTALHLLLRTGWNAHTHLWSCNERLHKYMHHCMWCTHKPCALHTFYSTYKKPKSPQLSYPKNDSWAVCEPPPPPTHTYTHPPCRTHKQKLLRRLVYNFTMNYLPYFISLVVQSLTARLDVQILHGMSACVTHLKVMGTCSWIKLVCHKLSCVTFLQKATRVLRQPVSTEGIWLPYITVNLLQYTVEWQ